MGDDGLGVIGDDEWNVRVPLVGGQPLVEGGCPQGSTESPSGSCSATINYYVLKI